MAKWTLQTAPTVEPVTVAELKTHSRIDLGDDDTYLDGLITTARQYIEEITWRSLINQTWDMKLTGWASPIRLPRPPLSSITHIKYYDTAGDQQTLSTDVYELDTVSEPGYVRLAYGQTWPTCRGHADDIEIRFVAGYGAAGSTVPRPIRHAIQLLAAHLYEQREPVITGPITKAIEFSLEALIAPYRCNDLLADFG